MITIPIWVMAALLALAGAKAVPPVAASVRRGTKSAATRVYRAVKPKHPPAKPPAKNDTAAPCLHFGDGPCIPMEIRIQIDPRLQAPTGTVIDTPMSNMAGCNGSAPGADDCKSL